MNLQDEYQTFLHDSSWYKHCGERNAPEAAYLALGMGEAGEFQGEIKKIVRKVGFRDDSAFRNLVVRNIKKILLELGDVLWYLTNMCAFFGVSIDELRVLNTLKLYRRMAEMDIKGELPIEMPEWPLTDYTLHEAEDLWFETFKEVS